MSDDNQRARSHFFLTQFLTLLISVFITGLMQIASEQAIYLFYFLPILAILMLIHVLMILLPKDPYYGFFICFNATLFIICCPLFFGIYFGIFNPTQSIQFDKASNCQIIGQMSSKLNGDENYSILYVDYEQDGKKYLGYSCLSDNYRPKTVQNIMPFRFYEKGDSYVCGTAPQGQSYDLENRILERKRNKRFLKASNSQRRCTSTYTFSSVKLSSWMCLPRDIDVQALLEPYQNCYTRFYSNYKDSLNNSINRDNLRESSEFMMVSFDSSIYYPKNDFIMLIVFTYYINDTSSITLSIFMRKKKIKKQE